MNDNKFGSYLKNIRKTKKMTLVEMAKLADTSNSYLSQIENGRRNPPKPNMIKKIAIALAENKEQEKYFYDKFMSLAGYKVTNSNGETLKAWSDSSLEWLYVHMKSTEANNPDLNSIILNTANLLKIYKTDTVALQKYSSALKTLVKYSRFDYIDLMISNLQEDKEVIKELNHKINKEYEIINELKEMQLNNMIDEIL